MYHVHTSHHITSLRVLWELYLISLIVSRLTPNVDSGAFYCIGQDLLGKNYTFSISSIWYTKISAPTNTNFGRITSICPITSPEPPPSGHKGLDDITDYYRNFLAKKSNGFSLEQQPQNNPINSVRKLNPDTPGRIFHGLLENWWLASQTMIGTEPTSSDSAGAQNTLSSIRSLGLSRPGDGDDD